MYTQTFQEALNQCNVAQRPSNSEQAIHSAAINMLASQNSCLNCEKTVINNIIQDWFPFLSEKLFQSDICWTDYNKLHKQDKTGALPNISAISTKVPPHSKEGWSFMCR